MGRIPLTLLKDRPLSSSKEDPPHLPQRQTFPKVKPPTSSTGFPTAKRDVLEVIVYQLNVLIITIHGIVTACRFTEHHHSQASLLAWWHRWVTTVCRPSAATTCAWTHCSQCSSVYTCMVYSCCPLVPTVPVHCKEALWFPKPDTPPVLSTESTHHLIYESQMCQSILWI